PDLDRGRLQWGLHDVAVRVADVRRLLGRNGELPLLGVDLRQHLGRREIVAVGGEEVMDAVGAVRTLRLSELAVDVARTGIGAEAADMAAGRLAVLSAVAIHHALITARLARPRPRHRRVAGAVVEAA